LAVAEYDFIAVEDLDVKLMLETSQSAKNRQDAARSRFLQLLAYKADLHGVHVVLVEPRDTTKACNQCGAKTAKPLWVREYSCPACGHRKDRDLNAAKNVSDKALAEVGAPFVRTLNSFHVGPGRSESTWFEGASLFRHHGRRSAPFERPVETALPTSTRHSASVDAKRVVEAGSPGSPHPG
jgi:putative transposase